MPGYEGFYPAFVSPQYQHVIKIFRDLTRVKSLSLQVKFINTSTEMYYQYTTNAQLIRPPGL